MMEVTASCGPVRLIEDAGSGRPLVLIHGWGGQPSQWEGVVSGLRNYRVFAAHLPGGPGLPLTGRVTLQTLGEGLAACLATAELQDVILLGHSMGGPVAVETAIAAADRVSGILGLDTLADRVFYGGSSDTQIADRRTLFEADPEGETRRMIDAIAAPGTHDAARALIGTDILASRTEDLSALRDAMFRWSVADRLAKIDVPLRLLNSVEVDATHRRDTLPCLSAIPQNVYGSGHFPQIEAPGHLLPHLLNELEHFHTCRLDTDKRELYM